ncbi:VRR-NUC domain-containing protein [Halomonas denitrificans]|nr:VRR-NUC domain-containing protein [Halomonas denitrificans]
MLPLAPDYYRRNFRFLIDFVRRHRGHLVDEALAGFIDRFEGLPAPAQCLFVRLLTRKGEWFRSDQLNYQEVGPIEPALQALAEANLVQLDPLIDIGALARLLRHGELKTLPQVQPMLASHRTKASLVNALVAQEWDSAPLTRWWPDAPFQLLAQGEAILVERLQLLFFANLHQSMSEFVVASLAHVRYPEVPLSPESFPFASADVVAQYQARERTARAWESGELDHDAWGRQLRDRQLDARLERQRQRHAFVLARQLEREAHFEPALALYRHCHYGEARERRLRLHFARGDHSAALSTALAMQAKPQSEQERVVAGRFLARLARQMPMPRLNTARPKLSEDLTELAWEGAVEEAVVAELRVRGQQAWHTENALLNGVAGLLLWPVIHAPLRGAFVQPFQHRPLDLYHTDFLSRRRELLAREWRYWRQRNRAEFTAGLLARYRTYQGIRCALVNWARLPAEALEAALPTLAPQQWLQLVDYLMADLPQRRSGQPDLMVVEKGALTLVEVKGPGDSLRDHQRRWLAELDRLGVTSRVLWVNKIDAIDT